MASPPWFYYPFKDIQASSLELSGNEVKHILGARRMHPGDEVVLMNGHGELAHCVLEEANKKARTLTLTVSLVAKLEPPKKQVVLASALPKGDRLSTMLDMACQLGMTHFQPLSFERSVSRWSDKLLQRCERILIEACKQSKTARVPEIKAVCDYTTAMSDERAGNRLSLLADPYGRPPSAYSSDIAGAQSLRIFIGPVGGVSEAEKQLAQQHKVAMLRLANSILRIETAAVAAVSVLTQEN